ncbi:MAG: hypothetical protein AB7C97_02815 [Oscillospiraceae bacterium]
MSKISPEDFDKMVAENLEDITPGEYTISDVNPWSLPIGRITWGLILTTVTLSFLWLQYLLPAVGVMLMYLGFRTLRGENRWFRACWLISGLKLLWNSANLILSVTPYGFPESTQFTFGVVWLVIQLILFFAFRRALLRVFKKSGQSKPEHDPLLAAGIWTVAAFAVALSPFSQSWIAFIIMIIAYIIIVRALFSVGKELDKCGYEISAAPVRIRGGLISRIYAVLLILAVVGLCFFFNHPPLNVVPFAPAPESAAREHLASLGYPEAVLSDLADSDVALMEDAVCVETSYEILSFDSHREENRETDEGGGTYIRITEIPGNTKLQITTVYAEMPGRRAYVLHYFEWLDGAALWQDGITIWANSDEDLQVSGGRLLYEKGGAAYAASFPRLSAGVQTTYGFFGASESSQIKGAVSYPLGAERQRGYVLFSFVSNYDSDMWAVSSAINYAHMSNPIRIPYADTEQRILNGDFTFKDGFVQHASNYDSAAYREAEK